MWSLDDLADSLAQALRSREAELTVEQTHSGLDSLSEVRLHEVLAAGMTTQGWNVLREIPFPSQVSAKRKKDETEEQAALRRERERCDLVVLPDGATSLADPREAFAGQLEKAASLFADTEDSPPAANRPSQQAQPQDAWWLEFKSAGQFRVVDGYAGADKSYSSFVAGVLRDAKKLNADAHIERSACCLVLFTAEREIAEHDLAALVHRLLDKDAPIRDQIVRHLPIADRIGNAWCSLALMRVRNDAAAEAALRCD